MKSGIDKMFTKKKINVLSIPVGFDGIGEESHPTIERKDGIRIGLDPFEEKIISIVKGKYVPIDTEKVEIKKGWKLYLNRIINILNNSKKKNQISKPSWLQKFKTKIFHWWIKDTTDDMKDLVNFVFIHGALGAPAIISLLTIFNIDILLVQIIRQSILLTIIVYIIGVGSGYYLFLDLNKGLEETWRKSKK